MNTTTTEAVDVVHPSHEGLYVGAGAVYTHSCTDGPPASSPVLPRFRIDGGCERAREREKEIPREAVLVPSSVASGQQERVP